METIYQGLPSNITSALPSQDDLEVIQNDTCPLCYNPYIAGKQICHTPCEHLFHTECLFRWIVTENKKNCP